MTIPRIMVVDDEPNSLFGICQILKDEGYRAIPAENGKQALEKIQADSIDILITDEKMPDMSGMELLSAVKKISGQIPVILITAYGSVSLAVEALKHPGAFTAKPAGAEGAAALSLSHLTVDVAPNVHVLDPASPLRVESPIGGDNLPHRLGPRVLFLRGIWEGRDYVPVAEFFQSH